MDRGDDSALPIVAYQGVPGAFSYEACGQAEPDLYAMPCTSFEEVIIAVRERQAERAVIPIENSIFGRVADIHRLLPKSGLHIVGEHFMPVRLQLLACPGAGLSDIKAAHSHPVALGQCRAFLLGHGIDAVPVADTAAAAADIAREGATSKAAIASASAGAIYGLDSVAADIQDDEDNTTRFVVMAREPNAIASIAQPAMTSFMFTVRNVPAALYKALGGFATASVNVVKIESYMAGGTFTAAQFYVEIEGHPEEERVRIAMDELRHYCSEIRILGVYSAHPYRARKC